MESSADRATRTVEVVTEGGKEDGRTEADRTDTEAGGHDGSRQLILNPVSGDSDHAEQVRDLADEHGFEVRETESEGDGIELAAEAARDGVSVLVAAGGDGTVNEVVRGLYEAETLDGPLFGIVPTGTGNNFAENVGIEGIEHAFEVIENGDIRTIDVALADERPFLNSCVGGLTADASSETTVDAKDSLGVFAYVIETFRAMSDFEGMRLHIEADGKIDAEGETNDDDAENDTVPSDSESWSGDAVCVLIGNGRRFPVDGTTQANIEDGLLDVTVIEHRPTARLIGEVALQRWFGTDTDNVDRFKTRRLDLSVLSDESVTFSLDGEMIETDDLSVRVLTRRLSLTVGEGYDPEPLAE